MGGGVTPPPTVGDDPHALAVDPAARTAKGGQRRRWHDVGDQPVHVMSGAGPVVVWIWVGLSYDGRIITRWGAIAKSQGEVLCLMNQLKEKRTVTAA